MRHHRISLLRERGRPHMRPSHRSTVRSVRGGNRTLGSRATCIRSLASNGIWFTADVGEDTGEGMLARIRTEPRLYLHGAFIVCTASMAGILQALPEMAELPTLPTIGLPYNA